MSEIEDQFRPRARDQCQSRSHLGQFLLANVQGIVAGRRIGIFTIRGMKRIRSNSNRRRRIPAPVIIAFHHSLVSGVPRRFCTTTRLVNSTAIRPSRAGCEPSTMLQRNSLAGKTSRQGLDLAHGKRMFVAPAEGICAETVSAIRGQRRLPKNRTDPQRTRRSISLPTLNPIWSNGRACRRNLRLR